MKCERCIPARAGQPRTAAVWGALDEVHPCARGATSFPSVAASDRPGCIPTRAGRPPFAGPESRVWLYRGPSPRVRGLDRSRGPRLAFPRFIPARAGETSRDALLDVVVGFIPARAGQPSRSRRTRSTPYGSSPRARDPPFQAVELPVELAYVVRQH